VARLLHGLHRQFTPEANKHLTMVISGLLNGGLKETLRADQPEYGLRGLLARCTIVLSVHHADRRSLYPRRSSSPSAIGNFAARESHLAHTPSSVITFFTLLLSFLFTGKVSWKVVLGFLGHLYSNAVLIYENAVV